MTGRTRPGKPSVSVGTAFERSVRAVLPPLFGGMSLRQIGDLLLRNRFAGSTTINRTVEAELRLAVRAVAQAASWPQY